MMKFLQYFKVTIEGNDKQASIKRLMAAIAFITYIIICFATYITHTEMVIGSLVTFIATMLGMTLYQNTKTPPIKDDSEIS